MSLDETQTALSPAAIAFSAPFSAAVSTVALTLELRRLIRATTPVTGLATQTAPEPYAANSTGSAGPGTDISWTSAAVRSSIWVTVPSLLTTQSEPPPTATAFGPGVEPVATTAFVRGSILEILFSSWWIAQTAPSPTATPVGSEPSLRVATSLFVFG